MVVSVAEKAGRGSRQVRSKETSESEPPMNCRKRIVDVRTGAGGRSGMSVGGVLKPGPRGVRLEGGVNLDQAPTRRAGDPCEAQRTDAGHRGRTARSRNEGAVMALDRRGRGVQPPPAVNR